MNLRTGRKVNDRWIVLGFVAALIVSAMVAMLCGCSYNPPRDRYDWGGELRKTAFRYGAKSSSDEARMVRAINKYRAKHDLPALKIDPTLMRVCRERVNCLSAGNPHRSPRYGSEWSHAGRYAKWKAIGGCVASDFSTPEVAVWAWTQSPGHARAMRGQHNHNGRYRSMGYDRVGVARGRDYYIAIFGKKESK